MDSDVEPWLAYMFRDVERAKFHVAGPLNHYSGKWNHMHSDLLLIKQQLDKVMQIAPSTPCVAPSGHFKSLQDSGVASNPEERS